MKEARSSAVEADGDNTADESDADHDGSDIARDTAMLLADCCEGQCCEPFDGPSEENHTGRYMCVPTSHSSLSNHHRPTTMLFV